MPVATIIDWYGPVRDRKTMIAAARWRRENNRIIYMGLRKGNIINYVGLTTSPHHRFAGHHALFADENVSFFIGEVVSQEVVHEGRRTPTDLALIERALVYYLQPELNRYLKLSPPDDCVSIFSRFYREKDGEFVGNPLPKFPSLLAYNHWIDTWHQG